MEFIIPEAIKKAMSIMKENGYESFIVGGCVRDFLMGKTPSDFDITTNAAPEKIIEIFEDKAYTVGTGIKHGTVTVIKEEAFYGCDELSEVFIPESVVEIGSSAFRQCESLKSIEIPSYTLVNERAFKESPTEIIWIE